MKCSARKVFSAALIALAVSGCASVKPKDYSVFRTEDPRSILVVPVLNNSTSVTAPDYFLSTISRPFAERGYYVFPANMVKGVLEQNGLADAALVHNADPKRLDTLFGCSAVLLITIDRWESQYVVLATTTTVQFDYILKSCKTRTTLWEDKRTMQYSPQANSGSGNPLADLIAQAIIAAIEKAEPNYMPLTQQANFLAAATAGQGLPAGPYLEAKYHKDVDQFPAARN
jgi:hypothetical protein